MSQLSSFSGCFEWEGYVQCSSLMNAVFGYVFSLPKGERTLVEKITFGVPRIFDGKVNQAALVELKPQSQCFYVFAQRDKSSDVWTIIGHSRRLASALKKPTEADIVWHKK